jgi:hypothetical protein
MQKRAPSRDQRRVRSEGSQLFDGGGLFLLVKPNGAKHWRLKYRFGGVEKLLALGSLKLVSLAEARAKRDNAKRLLLDGIDPAARRLLSAFLVRSTRNARPRWAPNALTGALLGKV